MRLLLAEAGVPWDEVMSMAHHEVFGFVVALGEAKGERFNWNRMRWEKPKG